MRYRDDNRVALENDAPRLDIAEKVCGTARYTTDYYLPKMMWAAYIRSDYGDARLRSADVAAAQAVQGVLEVEVEKKAGRYHGDRLGHICAESRQALEAGLAALDPKFTSSCPRTRLEEERTERKELKPADNDAEAQKVLDESDVVVEAEFQTQVQTHVLSRAARLRRRFPRRLGGGLRLDAKQHRIPQRPGPRAGAAARSGRVPLRVHRRRLRQQVRRRQRGPPRGATEQEVRPTLPRDLRSQGRASRHRQPPGQHPVHADRHCLRTARIRGGRIATWGSVGPTGGGQASAGGGGGGGVRNPSRYDFGTIAKVHEDVSLDGGYPRAMRAPGNPQAMFAIELMMDLMAEQVGMDPLEFRLLNETSDIRREMLKVGAEKIGWSNRRPDGSVAWPDQARLGDRRGRLGQRRRRGRDRRQCLSQWHDRSAQRRPGHGAPATAR